MCKGLVFKAHVRHYFYAKDKQKDGDYIWTDFSIRKDRSLVLLKLSSCPGCDECKHVRTKMLEISKDYPVYGMDKIVDGKKYKLNIVGDLLPIFTEVKE